MELVHPPDRADRGGQDNVKRAGGENIDRGGDLSPEPAGQFPVLVNEGQGIEDGKIEESPDQEGEEEH